MKQNGFIEPKKAEEAKKRIEEIKSRGEAVTVTVRKSRTKSEKHEVIIDGIYQKFFTVKNTETGLAFTVQFVDMLTGNITITEKTCEK